MSLIPIVPSAVHTSDGSADFGGWTPDLPLAVQLDVTAVSGTSPTLALHVEQTFDGVNWASFGFGPFNGIDAVGAYRLVVEDVPGVTGLYRVRWALGGTSPSFTFGVIVGSKP